MKKIIILWFFLYSGLHNFSYAGKLYYQSIEEPITSAKLFKECHKEKQPGTKRSSLCGIWDSQIKHLEKQLNVKCGNSGENIYKTVDNVEGIVVVRANDRQKHHFHKNEDLLGVYVMPELGRFYRAIEYDYGKGVKHYSISNIRKGPFGHGATFDSHHDRYDEPTQRYEISYTGLTTSEEQRIGLYGDKTIITDRKTKKVLAERIFYYYVIGNRQITVDNQRLPMPGRYNDFRYIKTCNNYAPPPSSIIKMNYPFSSYNFAIKVLTPKKPTKEESKYIFALSRNSGFKRKSCDGSLSVGPDIKPSDLTIKRAENYLHIGLDEENMLTCKDFFNQFRGKFSLVFFDGYRMTQEQILDKGNIKRR